MQMNVLRAKQVSHVESRDDDGQPIAGGDGQRRILCSRFDDNDAHDVCEIEASIAVMSFHNRPSLPLPPPAALILSVIVSC